MHTSRCRKQRKPCLERINKSGEDVTHDEILLSQTRSFCQLRPNLTADNASLFQKYKAVSNNFPSRGNHVQIMYPSHLIKETLSRAPEVEVESLPSTEYIDYSVPVS